jgi:GAF domain-containing protein
METEPQRDAMARLVTVIQELSLARDVTTVMAIVRHAARALTGADGARFVLREGDMCYYADAEAIGPLWKGQRFPINACISGWAMLHRQPAVVEDIDADPRIPTEAYEPTFVKSLVMVPIRTVAPLGAIGTYWAQQHRATPEEVAVLQALADSTAVALENVQLYAELEQRVTERTAALHREMAERQRLQQEAQRAAHFALLGRLAAGVAHEIRNPLGAVFLHVDVLREELQHPSPDSATAIDEALTEITRQLSRLEDLVHAVLRTGVLDRRVNRRGARAHRRRGHRRTDRLDPLRHWDRVAGDSFGHGASRPTGGLIPAITGRALCWRPAPARRSTPAANSGAGGAFCAPAPSRSAGYSGVGLVRSVSIWVSKRWKSTGLAW